MCLQYVCVRVIFAYLPLFYKSWVEGVEGMEEMEENGVH